MSFHSDSDEEQRFKEAVVSADSILSGSAIAVSSSDNVQRHNTLPAPAETLKGNHFKSTNFEDLNESLSSAQKRRRRKRKDSYNNGHISSKETCHDSKSSEHTSETIIPRKKRKKKSKEKIE